MTEAPSILRDIGASEFLKHYWQKKPLLVRRAIPDFESPLEADELAGLACEEGVESRLIEIRGGEYHLENGPFNGKRFGKLPKRNWTLLVQDIEKHLPELAAYLDRFDFIPRWRIDDLMVSYATEGGGVGPHTDAYDVFLLQAKGKRRWSIAENFDPSIVPGADVRVLKTFRAEQEWTLEPGDMLYLPPNVAHEGIALDNDCMTWSIGFRAPSLRDMLSDFGEWLYQRLPEDRMYTDPDLGTDEAGDGRISPAGFARMRQLLREAISTDDAMMDRWFGQFMTEPKPWLHSEASEDTPGAPAFAQRLTSDALLRDTRAMSAWSPSDNGATLFVNGEAWDVAPGLEGLLETVCTRRRCTYTELAPFLNGDGIALLRRLHTEGVLHFASMLESDND